MARFSRLQVATTMQETGVVPLFYHDDIETSKKVLRACYEGGARLLEFTNRGDFAQQVFGELNKFAARELPEMILGVGSVVDAGTASLYMQLGANFVVSPMLVEEMAPVCNRRKVLWSPGCGTLTEVTRALELGAEIVKIFPGSQLGPGFVNAITSPCPWVSIMPTGGVRPTEENLRGWFEAGAVCVGMGSKLVEKQAVRDGDFDRITQKCRQALDIVQRIREDD
ncbi:MAG TPA: bifunctional 4-hydroxy-2-oxoglutarate aldolase/2-dehydro-3-deoxy-phosphogluconate aldolase [Balneolaceae bacterium]|nr:bifunctional 4-hydroxy-2-oxoglutarate aldolase/2-dehydro-3-deoxy-phosphogluconate aldolase [Balneolaceae bacterium]